MILEQMQCLWFAGLDRTETKTFSLLFRPYSLPNVSETDLCINKNLVHLDLHLYKIMFVSKVARKIKDNCKQIIQFYWGLEACDVMHTLLKSGPPNQT